jgi:diguanylate cyclase (GGDEF)-like protein
MPLNASTRSQQPLNSLATKLILFVFISTFVTALVVSGISIQSTHTYLSQQIGQQYPAALGQAGEAVLEWLVGGQEEIGSLAKSSELRRAPARSATESSTPASEERRSKHGLNQVGAAVLDWFGGNEAGSGSESPRDTNWPARVTAQLASAQRRSKHFDAFVLVGGDASVRRVVGEAAGLAPGRHLPLTGVDRTVLRMLNPDSARMLVAAAPFPVDPDGSGTLIGVFKASRIPSLLAQKRPVNGAEMLVIDSQGNVIYTTGEGPHASPFPLDTVLAAGPDQVLEYATASSLHVVGAARPLGIFDWQVAVEVPFEIAFAPVLSAVMRVFVSDLCIILLFSYLAYRITLAGVRPIEALSEAARRIAQGQFDLAIPEPRAHDEIGLLTRTFNDMMRKLRGYQMEIETTNRSLLERNAELQRANEVLNQLSITDGLTKLHNHRFFQDELTREIKRVNRANTPLSMLLIDLDDFKGLNDRLGHPAGDELLTRIARTMEGVVRSSDLLARYGGEEFVVLASDTDLVGAYRLAEKLRTTIAEQSLILGDSMRPTRITVSIGVAEFRGNRHKFFSAADQALYRAKASGKNCVMVDDDAALRSALDGSPPDA